MSPDQRVQMKLNIILGVRPHEIGAKYRNSGIKLSGSDPMKYLPNIIKHCTLIKSIKSPETYHVPYTEVVSCKFQNDANLGGHCNVF